MNISLLERYQAIEDTSERMVDAASRGDWAEVSRLEAHSQHQIEQLRLATPHTPLSRAQQARKQRILLSILRHDALVRNLAEPSLGGVDLLFHRQGPAQLH